MPTRARPSARCAAKRPGASRTARSAGASASASRPRVSRASASSTCTTALVGVELDLLAVLLDRRLRALLRQREAVAVVQVTLSRIALQERLVASQRLLRVPGEAGAVGLAGGDDQLAVDRRDGLRQQRAGAAAPARRPRSAPATAAASAAARAAARSRGRTPSLERGPAPRDRGRRGRGRPVEAGRAAGSGRGAPAPARRRPAGTRTGPAAPRPPPWPAERGQTLKGVAALGVAVALVGDAAEPPERLGRTRARGQRLPEQLRRLVEAAGRPGVLGAPDEPSAGDATAGGGLFCAAFRAPVGAGFWRSLPWREGPAAPRPGTGLSSQPGHYTGPGRTTRHLRGSII